MEAHSFRRMYPRLKKGLKRFSKATLLSVVFLFILLGNIAPTFAGGIFDEYKYLFHTADAPEDLKVGTNSNTFTKKAWIVQGQTIPGIWLNFSYVFGTEKGTTNPEYSWDHIDADNGNQIFIIRSCDTGTTNCLYSTIPYNQYQSGVVTATNTTIFRRAGSFYYKTESVDIKATTWESTDGQSATPDFLTKQAQSVSIWYCASKPSNNVITGGNDSAEPKDAADTANDPDIQKFGNLCGGKTYFKINQIDNVKPSSLQQEAQNMTGTTSDTTPTPLTSQIQSGDGLPECSITNGTVGSGSWMGCVAQVVYYAIYRPIAWVAGLLGELFDFFLGYSLNDASYRADFAVRGWQIVRDISNVFFIIILVWVGLSTVFKTSTNLKRVVPNLILNALIINFSLFATRVVIDISNVIARVFYHSVSVCDGKCQPRDSTGKIPNLKPGIAGYTPLSEKILSGFNPQKIFDTSVLDQANALPDNGTATVVSSQQNQSKPIDLNSNEGASYYTIVSLIAALIVFAIAMMFWKTAFFFLGRVIGLYIAMIFAPFAFLGRGNIPLASGIKELSWDNWLKDLTSYALLAPIFVFFLYIVYSMIDSGFITVFTTSTGRNFFETVLFIAIPMLIIYFLIIQGVKIASAYAGSIGRSIQGFVDKTVGGIGGVVGGGVGLAAGGAALGLRGASTLLNQGAKKWGWTEWAAKNAEDNKAARLLNQGFKWSQTSSMDVRNAGIKIGKKEYTAGGTFSKSLGFLGAKPDYKLADNVGLGQKAFLGGNVKIKKDRDKRETDRIKNAISYDHLSDTEAKEVWQKKIEKDAKKKAEKEWQKNIEKDAAVKPKVDELRQREDAVKDAEQTLATATASGDPTSITLARSALKFAQDDRDQSKEQLQKIALQTIADLKANGGYVNSAAYTKTADDERDRLKKDFGEIKDAKSLTSAMRAEYARNLRENSFWMKDGKPRWGLSTGGGIVGGDLALTLTSLNAVYDAGIGAIVGGHIKELQNSFERASKTVMDEHKRTVGKGSEIGKWEEKLKHYDEKIKDLVKLHKGVENIDVDDIDNAATIEDALIVEMAEKNKTITALDKKGDARTKQDEIDLARARAEVNKYRNLQEDRDKLKDKINAGKAKNKESEDKKNKDGDKGDNLKGDKK